MTIRLTHAMILVTALGGLTTVACSEGDSESEATGGTTATGGAGTGGTTTTSGGTTAAGASSGGTTATGGTTGAEEIYTFDSTKEAFQFEVYTPAAPYENLGATSVLSQVTEAGSDGKPGMLKLEVPFTGYNQQVDIQTVVAAPFDWSGKVLVARVRIESGYAPDPSAPGGGFVFVKTGTTGGPQGTGYIFGRGAWTNIPPTNFGEWVELAFELDNPGYKDEGYDPSQIVAVGLQLSTGQGGATSPAPTAAVAYVDTFTIE